MPTYNARVYRKQGATELVVDSSGYLNISSGKVTLPTQLRKGYINVDLFSGRALASAENFNNFGPWVGTATQSNAAMGGLLSGGGDPNLQTFSTVGAQAPFIGWASGTVTAVRFPPIVLPSDFDSATAVTITYIAERASDNASNNVIDTRVWVGVNATEMGTTGSTLTSTPTAQSITVSATAFAGNGNWLSIQVVPGTHTNNAVRLYGMKVEYGRVSS